MSRMHNNTWVFFVPIVIIMKIECTIPDKTGLLEFALFIKFVTSHKRRQIESGKHSVYNHRSTLVSEIFAKNCCRDEYCL